MLCFASGVQDCIVYVCHTNRLRQQHWRTYLPTFNLSLSMVVVISQCTLTLPPFPIPHFALLFHAHVPLLVTEVLLSGPRVWSSLPATIRQITSYGQFRQHIYLGPINRSALWLLIIVCYTNTLTYLLGDAA